MIEHDTSEASGVVSGSWGRHSWRRWWRCRWARWLAWLVVALLALWVVAWLAVPPITRWQVQKVATEKLGRPVHIGAVRFKPWSLELTLRDLTVGGARPADPPQFTARRLYANLELESALRLAPVLEAIEVDGPALRLRYLGDGHYDVDDVIARLTSGPKPPPDQKPVHFALYNIAVRDGRVTFIDEPAQRTHEVRDLRLTLPFISNLPSQREVHVTPQLTFTVDGSRFDSGAQTLPFDASHRTEARLQWQHVDLAPYLSYQPASLPLRAMAGVLDVDARLSFEQTPKPALRITGTASLSGVKANSTGTDTATDGEALAFDRLTVQARDVRPLERVVHLADVTLTAPRLLLSRDAQGRIDGMPTSDASDPATATSTQAAARASQASQTTAAKRPAPDADDWRVMVDHLAIAQGDAQWRDALPAPGRAGHAPAPTPTPARIHVAPFSLEARNLVWPAKEPATFSGRLALADVAVPPSAPASASAVAPASAPFIAFQGQARMSDARVAVQARDLPLQLAQPYLAAAIEPRLTGEVDADAEVTWGAPASQVTVQKAASADAKNPDANSASAPGLTFAATRLALNHLALLGDAKGADGARAASPRKRRADDLPPGTLASLGALVLEGAQVDLPRRSVSVDTVTVQTPRVRVARDADGRWMFEDWLTPLTTTTTTAAHVPPAPKPESRGNPPPWRVRLGHVAVSNGGIVWRDQQPAPGVVDVMLSRLTLDARQFELNSSQPFTLELSALLAPRYGEPGKLAWRGAVGLAPLSARGEVDAQRLPAQAFAPYVAGLLNIDILRADASFKGKVDYAQQRDGPRLRVAGDARIEELRTASHPGSAAGNDAAQTADAAASAATVATAPAAPSHAALAPDGGAGAAGGLGEELLSWKQLRVAGLDVRLDPGKAPQVDVKDSQLSDFYARVIVHPNGRINLQDLVKSAAPAQPASAASVASAAMPPASGASGAVQASGAPDAPIMHFGPTRLVHGQVAFSDHFIQPNYSADLSELNGQLGAFSTVTDPRAPQMAALTLTGRAEGTAQLAINGQLNPLAQPLALDVAAKVSDLELPPLSPYAVKYSGHGIERGKLSMDVRYKIAPDGQLTASNRLVLNQLQFGQQVPGAPASLPVTLATALLADSNGVIDLDLPISGSLNDPQFSLGPIIVKAIFNLIGKAVTAPFTLLARAFGGGGDDMSQVPFAPGSAALSDAAQAQLAKIAQAMTDRPHLKLTVIGMARLGAERAGLQRERLKALVAAERRASRSGAGATDTTEADAAAQPASAASGAASEAIAASASAPASAASAASTATDADYPQLLRRLYRRADIPGKPRNAIGMTRDVPVAQMEALLLAHIAVSEDDIRQLATRRAVAVKDYLVAHHLDAGRVFVGAIKTDDAGSPASPPASATASAAEPANAASAPASAPGWTPHAELQLEAR